MRVIVALAAILTAAGSVNSQSPRGEVVPIAGDLHVTTRLPWEKPALAFDPLGKLPVANGVFRIEQDVPAVARLAEGVSDGLLAG